MSSLHPGDHVVVTFSVRVASSAVATTVITNVGTVKSDLAKATSNPVTNRVVAVLGEKFTKPGRIIKRPAQLAATGSTVPVAPLLELGLVLALSGGLLIGSGRRGASQ